ncbi:MAG TPA: TetR/AcrR family transcriptional regulator [Acidimicrobiales bacterium]|nr:TetR/AcrR family transcriptional regulator [Acidimicrobiales bacterium]
MPAVSDAMPRRRSRSPRGQGEQLREEILVAAERMLIETNDESALSIRAIAAAVGVTPPSIYLHFADRNDLVFAVCERQAEQIDQVMEQAAEAGTDPWDRIRRRGLAYLRWGLDNPEHYRILMMSRPDATPERFVDQRLADTSGLAAVAEDIGLAAAEGRIAPVDDPVKEAELFWMVIHGMVSMLIAKPDFPFGPPEELYDEMFNLVYRGLAPRP